MLSYSRRLCSSCASLFCSRRTQGDYLLALESLLFLLKPNVAEPRVLFRSAVVLNFLYSSTMGSYAVVRKIMICVVSGFRITQGRGIFVYMPSRAHTQGFVHLVVITSLTVASKRVDLESSASLYDFYMLIWKAFYLEYILLPFCTFA